jgi:hypothetical protein
LFLPWLFCCRCNGRGGCLKKKFLRLIGFSLRFRLCGRSGKNGGSSEPVPVRFTRDIGEPNEKRTLSISQNKHRSGLLFDRAVGSFIRR